LIKPLSVKTATQNTLPRPKKQRSMAKRTRRNHKASFKEKKILAALTGEKTLSELVGHYEVHANQITTWKPPLVEQAVAVLNKGSGKGPAPDFNVLHVKIVHLILGGFFKGALNRRACLAQGDYQPQSRAWNELAISKREKLFGIIRGSI